MGAALFFLRLVQNVIIYICMYFQNLNQAERKELRFR